MTFETTTVTRPAAKYQWLGDLAELQEWFEFVYDQDLYFGYDGSNMFHYNDKDTSRPNARIYDGSDHPSVAHFGDWLIAFEGTLVILSDDEYHREGWS